MGHLIMKDVWDFDPDTTVDYRVDFYCKAS